jgi:hypothetical protein
MFLIGCLCVGGAVDKNERMPTRIAFAVGAALFGIPPLVRLWIVGVLG